MEAGEIPEIQSPRGGKPVSGIKKEVAVSKRGSLTHQPVPWSRRPSAASRGAIRSARRSRIRAWPGTLSGN